MSKPWTHATRGYWFPDQRILWTERPINVFGTFGMPTRSCRRKEVSEAEMIAVVGHDLDPGELWRKQ